MLGGLQFFHNGKDLNLDRFGNGKQMQLFLLLACVSRKLGIGISGGGV